MKGRTSWIGLFVACNIGVRSAAMRGPNIATELKAMVIDYIDQRYGAGSAVPASTVSAAE